jgi:hypothetical protein
MIMFIKFLMDVYDIQYSCCVPRTVKSSNIMGEILKYVVVREEAGGNTQKKK